MTSFTLPLSRYPGMNRMVLDWLGGDERFLPRGRTPEGPRGDAEMRSLAAALADSNRRWGIDAAAALTAWERRETTTLVAGQQVGFAGGPLYTLAKLATLVRMKRDLERTEKPATAFFWLATEDHDFAEVATLNLPVTSIPRGRDVNRQLDLVRIRAAARHHERTAVGALPVPEDLITALTGLYGIERPSWLRQGITFRDSFAELVASLFGSEVILVDALLPELRRTGAPLLRAIASQRDEVQSRLAARAAELTAAGYREQVTAREGDEYTLLFALDGDGRRQPLDASTVEPERISTSALTRPLLQDSVLEPDVFIGGPAEVAYYAQLAPLHRLFGVRMPRIALRGHALVAPARIGATLTRYDIDPADVFSDPDAILAHKDGEAVGDIERIVTHARQNLLGSISQIADAALPADRSLANSFERTVGHLDYHFEKLRERAVRAVVRKDRERHEAVRKLVSTLYPDRSVQDRVTAWFPWWSRYGSALTERLVEEIEPDSDTCKVVLI